MRIMEIFHLDDMTPGQRAEVLELRTEKASLEDVFLELEGDGNA